MTEPETRILDAPGAMLHYDIRRNEASTQPVLLLIGSPMGAQTTVEEQADDLHWLIDALGAGPVDIFATSGGAVNALALVAGHPEQVRILVAHEPPAAQERPDREAVLAACQGIKETYLREGWPRHAADFLP